MDAIVLVFVLLAGAAAEAGGETEADAGANPGDKVDPRFPAVIYQVQNRSFEDSDGIGDLRGEYHCVLLLLVESTVNCHPWYHTHKVHKDLVLTFLIFFKTSSKGW